VLLLSDSHEPPTPEPETREGEFSEDAGVDGADTASLACCKINAYLDRHSRRRAHEHMCAMLIMLRGQEKIGQDVLHLAHGDGKIAQHHDAGAVVYQALKIYKVSISRARINPEKPTTENRAFVARMCTCVAVGLRKDQYPEDLTPLAGACKGAGCGYQKEAPKQQAMQKINRGK
jgi:hypothetical protein